MKCMSRDPRGTMGTVCAGKLIVWVQDHEQRERHAACNQCQSGLSPAPIWAMSSSLRSIIVGSPSEPSDRSPPGKTSSPVGSVPRGVVHLLP